MELKPGAFVAAKYRVVRVLGRGAMGTVWEAVHTLTDRRVALKILAEDHRTTEARARILREARACGRIQHKNVIEVFDIAELDDGRPFLVMPILHGETLEERIERLGPCSEAEALEIGVGVARALVAAHALGIVHRDLKPSNIFLHSEPGTSEVTVKVLDFGISKILSRDEASYTDAGRAVGSPAYMSPEQAKGAADIDGRSDVWSFGVCLFEMLTGGLPFPGETPYAMVGHILHGPPPDFDALCPSLSAELRGLLRRCVVRDPDKRLGSAAQLLDALGAARGDAAPLSLSTTGPHALQQALAPQAAASRPFGPAPPAVTSTVPLPASERASRDPPADPRPASSLTATSSVLITQKVPTRGRGSLGLVLGIVLALAAAAALALVVRGRAPSTQAVQAEAAQAATPSPTASAATAAAAPPTASQAASGASPSAAPSPPEEPAAAEAPSTATTAAPSAPPPKSPAPAKRPPLRAPPPAKTGRVALPDSPG